MKTLEYSFTEVSQIKITWERSSQLYKAEYFIGDTLQFFAKESTIEKVMQTLELMAPIFLGEIK